VLQGKQSAPTAPEPIALWAPSYRCPGGATDTGRGPDGELGGEATTGPEQRLGSSGPYDEVVHDVALRAAGLELATLDNALDRRGMHSR
jgi:hypothetical protein